MKKAKKTLTIFSISLLTGIALTSCNIYSIVHVGERKSSSVSLSKADSKASSSDGANKGSYYLANDSAYLYGDVERSIDLATVPSTGDVHLLAIPVEISGYSFSANFRTDLDHVLNGQGKTDTGYWESLASFYEESSYGNLHLSFDIADTYDCGYTASELVDYDTKNGTPAASEKVLNEAVENIASVKGADYLKQFDNDGDGWLDGIILIYSCPNYLANNNNKIYQIDKNGTFWAYTYWARNDPNTARPTANTYFWCSYDFLYEAVHSPKVDSHTLIHEFGHMMGLDDYYGMYDARGNQVSGYNPAGSSIMEDENICDHDAFSKYALGWLKPYVITGDSTITITPSQDGGEGSAILIPSASYNDTPFGEYLLLELYTPTGLNYLDSHVKYSSRPLGVDVSGIRMWHVDSRLADILIDSKGNVSRYSYFTGDELEDNHYYRVAATNSQKNAGFASNSAFDLLSLVDASGVKDFRNGDYAGRTTLFQSGNEFNPAAYKKYFTNKTAAWNDGTALDFTISFDKVSEESATVTIEFTA